MDGVEEVEGTADLFLAFYKRRESQHIKWAHYQPHTQSTMTIVAGVGGSPPRTYDPLC